MPNDPSRPGLSEALGDPLVAAVEDALTLATYSYARPRRHDALLAQQNVPQSWAAWCTQPALYALLDRIARSRLSRPSQLAEALGLSRSTVSHELRRLEDRRLIYRNDFAVPRWRGKIRPIFSPTVHGYNALRQLRSVRRAAVAEAVRDWSDEDKVLLARLLHRLAASSAPPSPGSPPSPGPAPSSPGPAPSTPGSPPPSPSPDQPRSPDSPPPPCWPPASRPAPKPAPFALSPTVGAGPLLERRVRIAHVGGRHGQPDQTLARVAERRREPLLKASRRQRRGQGVERVVIEVLDRSMTPRPQQLNSENSCTQRRESG